MLWVFYDCVLRFGRKSLIYPLPVSAELHKEDACSSRTNPSLVLGWEWMFSFGQGLSTASSKSSFPELENQRQLLKDNILISVKAPQLNVCTWLPAGERVCKLRTSAAVKHCRFASANRVGLLYWAKQWSWTHTSRAPSCTSCGRWGKKWHQAGFANRLEASLLASVLSQCKSVHADTCCICLYECEQVKWRCLAVLSHQQWCI